MSRLYLSKPCAFFTTHCTRCCGRSQRPVFPAPSLRRGSNEIAKLRRKSRREIESACLSPVIASEAKQSSFLSLLRQERKLDCFVASLLAMRESVPRDRRAPPHADRRIVSDGSSPNTSR